MIAIRPYQPDDVDELYVLVMSSLEHLIPWMPWCHRDYSRADTHTWVDACIDDWQNKVAFRYIIYDTDDSRILGCVGLERVEWAHKIAVLGYWVGAGSLNRGVATVAAKLAAVEAFTVFGLQRLEIEVLTDNHASNRVALKMGAVFEACCRNKIYHLGRSHDANFYGLIPSDI